MFDIRYSRFTALASRPLRSRAASEDDPRLTSNCRRPFVELSRLRSFFDRDKVSLVVSGVDLSRTIDSRGGIGVHFAPVGNPTGKPSDRKQHGKHLHRDSQCPIDHAGVEVDVRIEFSLDEVLILERDLFQLLRHVEQRIVQVKLGQQFVATGADDRGTRVAILVDAVPEAHQSEVVVLVLGHVDILLDVATIRGNPLEHVDAGLIGSAVQRSPQCADAGRDGGKQIGIAAADHPHRRRAAVLFVVGMDDQQQIQSFRKVGIDLIVRAGVANIMCRKFSQ